MKFVEEQSKHRPERVPHTKRVYDTALILAKRHNVNEHQVALAAIFHDLAKGMMSFEEQGEYIQRFMDRKLLKTHKNLWHGFVASDYIKRFLHIHDVLVQDAIFYHVTGHPEIDEIGKILIVADYCEPGRKIYEKKGKKFFDIAMKNLNKGVLEILNDQVSYLRKGATKVHKDDVWTMRMIEKLEREVFHD
jgi:predicted HD superfamily hydrolase involved in NAD metabolism